MSPLLLLAQESSIHHSGKWFLDHAWIIPAVPAASFVLILFTGKRWKYKGAEIGIAALGIAFVLSLCVGVQWIQYADDAHHDVATEEQALSVAGPVFAADEPGTEEVAVPAVEVTTTWFENESVEVEVGTLIDGLAVMMLFVVTTISLLVHIYSTDYVHGDVRYTHFFAFLSLFTASMLTLVIAQNTLMLITAWELVGVCSFVLIGHWWEDKANSDAALKAFLTNRVGDMGLIIGMSILYFSAGRTFNIVKINEMANAGEIDHLPLMVASICLLGAVMSKSGQFFLHTWLPDAMAGPTPVSALIHAATMVVAGVFMIARMYGVFYHGLSIGGSSINLMALIGGVTTIAGACLAFVQRDIKKVLAYSTVSQLGYMVMALGVGAWTAALFHLFTHAFFKAGLFLGAGSVSHAVHHSFDMKSDMGGLKKYMPKTFWTFIICSVALAGVFPVSGFWSKDEILAGTGGFGLFGGTGGNGTYYAMLVMGLVTAGLTAAYMTRCIYLTFFGDYRGHGTPHESGPRITTPLIILSAFAIFAGFINLPKNLFGILPDSWALRFEHYVEPKGAYFPGISHARASYGLAILALLVVGAAIAIAYHYYFILVDRKGQLAGKRYTELPDGPTTRFAFARAGHTFLVNKYYLDHLYNNVIVYAFKKPFANAAYWFNQKVLDGIVDGSGKGSVAAGRAVYKYIDQGLVDGIVNGSGVVSDEAGQGLRKMQSGKVQQYAAIMFVAVAILAGILVIVVQ
ncbi:MAG TPA: NADH-quinone oxidoreductase subunit L [Acidimicrobiales bacterium]|nr:NADH-quinone oxidoreductase subunit L [Acidimicrobiales bacterium]